MKKEELKLGNKIKGIFRGHSKHTIIGEITEISTDEHELKGTWVGVKITGGDTNDRYVSQMAEYGFGVMIPLKDVKEVLR